MSRANDFEVNTFPLYIYSNNSPRCDFAEWRADRPEDDWKLRMDFKVFRFQEPGLVKIFVMLKSPPWRMLAVRDKSKVSHLWKLHLDFWAYGEPQPGTQRIWSGFQAKTNMVIFVKGGREGMEDWAEQCEFWVPI